MRMRHSVTFYACFYVVDPEEERPLDTRGGGGGGCDDDETEDLKGGPIFDPC
eukprot:CAMPEP_0185278902 /NCGR_PEP_ID=MMETSP1359-20130426/62184_1 /TAXON_ID=552665 /ORGANISM="Bigelowiella longifila, Strain CCMP242" /LENGTH=51 /DNA_ID=CAMNT_0027873587 /DNA_START=60 /DNA_END=215 /DNA_ORIENTATION=+